VTSKTIASARTPLCRVFSVRRRALVVRVALAVAVVVVVEVDVHLAEVADAIC